ncbi:transcriptional regulator [Catellatospora sp. TT07R-123]|uniref:helix-turn-helix domain-containing protein n=1 Tax=Catellatospora sp. TT07R-123 TaxID=2733863 RepID=UPI001B1E8C90|nr:helix-turn-helix domain-containing protein [Catellatospora sp. TT07R-123]GHJ46877.1 transcriptional regulator [Catellatospora sp. TT07R-123]
MSENRTVPLTDPVALRAFAHPLRMSLVGLLRREGPLTATQAAERLGESVPGCSFHLRQLAKYGLVERVPGADARERPWRATALFTSWGTDSADPEVRAAVDHLDAVVTRRFYDRAIEWLRTRDQEPAAWRRVTGPGDVVLHVTLDEYTELERRFNELVEPYLARQSDPSARPEGARTVNILQFVLTTDRPQDPAP